jgi:hypothetical protein
MNKVVIYPREDGGVVVLYPCECGLSIEEVARKDVPAGLPYLFGTDADVPKDTTYREAWVADFSQPDGIGVGPEVWATTHPPESAIVDTPVIPPPEPPPEPDYPPPVEPTKPSPTEPPDLSPDLSPEPEELP